MANGNNHGTLRIQIVSRRFATPVTNATIQISSMGNPEDIITTVNTDENGVTENVELESPPVEYSMSPSENQPYSEYNLKIQAPGFDDEFISGVQIFTDEQGIQPVEMQESISDEQIYDPTIIGAHTLWEEYPPKIAEAEIKTVGETGEIVLSRVVIPETVVVHDGAPTDSTATNYYVPYKDYIKNVACNEIYTTWPEAALRANILAIMSFTLNRVYTEWYRGKGYDFTITSSTAFDQKWIYGKTIYEDISQIVDEEFANYLTRPNIAQPLLTQYCDGKRVSCPNWMTQWGSKQLADDGLSAIEILRYYYGNNLNISSAETIAGIPASYPGYDLSIGSSGDKVLQLQEQLNRIAQNYPAIGTIATDGIYGPNTAEAVKKFQQVFNLPATGITNYSTWYKISQIYVGVTKIAENV